MPRHAAFQLLALLMLATLLAACGLGTAPEADRLALDPLTLARTGKANDFLACPEGHCTAAADRPAPVLDLAAADQLRLWEEVVTTSPRARILHVDDANLRLHAEQRSRIMRFVDTIAIHVIPLPEGRSTFAAYSRSELGSNDFGVNQARLEDWIARLEAASGR